MDTKKTRAQNMIVILGSKIKIMGGGWGGFEGLFNEYGHLCFDIE
jgi:hypothetical protein